LHSRLLYAHALRSHCRSHLLLLRLGSSHCLLLCRHLLHAARLHLLLLHACLHHSCTHAHALRTHGCSTSLLLCLHLRLHLLLRGRLCLLLCSSRSRCLGLCLLGCCLLGSCLLRCLLCSLLLLHLLRALHLSLPLGRLLSLQAHTQCQCHWRDELTAVYLTADLVSCL
jgi:hypothetical protein